MVDKVKGIISGWCPTVSPPRLDSYPTNQRTNEPSNLSSKPALDIRVAPHRQPRTLAATTTTKQSTKSKQSMARRLETQWLAIIVLTRHASVSPHTNWWWHHAPSHTHQTNWWRHARPITQFLFRFGLTHKWQLVVSQFLFRFGLAHKWQLVVSQFLFHFGLTHKWHLVVSQLLFHCGLTHKWQLVVSQFLFRFGLAHKWQPIVS